MWILLAADDHPDAVGGVYGGLLAAIFSTDMGAQPVTNKSGDNHRFCMENCLRLQFA